MCLLDIFYQVQDILTETKGAIGLSTGCEVISNVTNEWACECHMNKPA